MGFRNYEAGEWLVARDLFLTCHYSEALANSDFSGLGLTCLAVRRAAKTATRSHSHDHKTAQCTTWCALRARTSRLIV